MACKMVQYIRQNTLCSMKILIDHHRPAEEYLATNLHLEQFYFR